MKKSIFLLLSSLSLFLSGCSSSIKPFQPLATTSSGANVYIYKNNVFTGYLMGHDVYLDNKIIGVLRNGHYFAISIRSRQHIIKFDDGTSLFGANYISAKFLAKNRDSYYFRIGFEFQGNTQMFSGGGDGP